MDNPKRNLTYVAIVVATVIAVRWWGTIKELLLSEGNLTTQFLITLISVFLSLLYGIPAGLRMNRSWESEQDIKGRKRLLEALEKDLEDNLGYIELSIKYLSEKNPPTFPMDLYLLESTVENQYIFLGDEMLFRNIKLCRFQLLHLNERMSFTRDCISADGGITLRELRNGIDSESVNWMKQLLDVSIDIAETTKKECKELKCKICCELKLLEKS